MRLLKTLVIVFVLEAMGVIGLMGYTSYHLTQRQQPKVDLTAYNKALVYEICQESRISPTISEDGCAQIQDALGYEYLCQANNASYTNHCWVEAKN